MKLDKYDRMFIAFMFVIVTIFNIGQCFAVEKEDVQATNVSGLVMTDSSNVFIASSETSIVSYVQMEKGYVYEITVPSNYTQPRIVAYSDDIPSVNGTYTYLATVQPGNTYSYAFNEDKVLYFDYWQGGSVFIKRYKIASQSNAVSDLVDNVGVNQLWGVFESGIDFVGVIVLCAFGFFLVFLLIKKITKGKSDF